MKIKILFSKSKIIFKKIIVFIKIYLLTEKDKDYILKTKPYTINNKIKLVKKDINKINQYFKKYPDKIISSGENNESVDGSGILSSVDKKIASNIAKYIYKKFYIFDLKFKPTLLDIGCGQGYLVKAFNQNNMIGYGFEGSKKLLNNFVSENIYIYDLTKKINNENLYKAFNITTSFEVAEHVPPELQKNFWDNISYLSDYHICSIHKCPPSSNIHPTIWSDEEWQNFFKKNNIEVIEKISQEIFNKECVGYPKNKKYIPIKNIRGNWPCSWFYILKF